jgi:glutaminase
MSQANQRLLSLFASIAQNGEYVTKLQFLDIMRNNGILPNDPRVLQTINNLEPYGDNDALDFETFSNIVRDNTIMIERILQGKFVVPNFALFCSDLKAIFEETRKNTGGSVATYIPQLGRVSPERFGLCVCTVDGQNFSLGDEDVPFCVQSASKV